MNINLKLLGYPYMRIIDLATSLLGLLILAPLMLLIAMLVKLETNGPALFKQTRIGKNGSTFTCLKFRSMFVDTANRPTHEVQTSSVTKIGYILRRTKLDEIPQLLNVISGQMGLVGPRPCLPSQIELIEAREKSGALTVRPGITGLAQVNGVDMSEPKRLALIDGYYAHKRSLCGDLGLIINTFKHVLTSKSRTDRPA